MTKPKTQKGKRLHCSPSWTAAGKRTMLCAPDGACGGGKRWLAAWMAHGQKVCSCMSIQRPECGCYGRDALVSPLS
jgi:hypothetical protein